MIRRLRKALQNSKVQLDWSSTKVFYISPIWLHLQQLHDQNSSLQHRPHASMHACNYHISFNRRLSLYFFHHILVLASKWGWHLLNSLPCRSLLWPLPAQSNKLSAWTPCQLEASTQMYHDYTSAWTSLHATWVHVLILSAEIVIRNPASILDPAPIN